jgi:hypothetical protein
VNSREGIKGLGQVRPAHQQPQHQRQEVQEQLWLKHGALGQCRRKQLQHMHLGAGSPGGRSSRSRRSSRGRRQQELQEEQQLGVQQ